MKNLWFLMWVLVCTWAGAWAIHEVSGPLDWRAFPIVVTAVVFAYGGVFLIDRFLRD